MTISLDVAISSRGDPSNWNRIVLMLWDGRCCIEILLGLALVEGIDLVQNPDVDLKYEEGTFKLDDRIRHCVFSDAESSTAGSDRDAACSSWNNLSVMRKFERGKHPLTSGEIYSDSLNVRTSCVKLVTVVVLPSHLRSGRDFWIRGEGNALVSNNTY